MKKILNVDLLVIDLTSCKRCVPTGDQLKVAVRLLGPVAEALGIELKHREIVVQTPQEAEGACPIEFTDDTAQRPRYRAGHPRVAL